MASSFSVNKGFEEPASGDYINAWATPVNSNWTAIDAALGGMTPISVTGVSAPTTTLTLTQYRPPNIEFTGTLAVNLNYQIPTGVGGLWSINNATTGAFTLAFSIAAGNSLTLGAGRTLIISDGVTVALAAPLGQPPPPFPQSAAEIAAGVTPTNSSYIWGDPRRYGAVGDGITDDTIALQNCHLCNQLVTYPGVPYNFKIMAEVPITVPGQLVQGNGSAITLGLGFVPNSLAQMTGFDISAISVTIRNLNWVCLAVGQVSPPTTAQNNYMRFNAGSHYGQVLNCQLFPLPDTAPFGCTIGFLQGANYCLAEGNTAIGVGLCFSQGAYTTIANNICKDPVDAAIAINSNSCVGARIIGNTIANTNGLRLPGMITIEEGPSDWVVANNVLTGKDASILALNIAYLTAQPGGIITGNIIDMQGTSDTNPISAIGLSQYYPGTLISNNKILNVQTGATGNTAIQVAAIRVRIIGNYIDATTGIGNVTAIQINPAGDFCDVIDNYINNTGNSRCVTVSAGSNSGVRIFFKGGSFIGGSTGIDTALGGPTNCPIWFENIAESTVTTFYNPSAPDSVATFFNSGHALDHPHYIKAGRSIYGGAIPTQGPWTLADEVKNIGPTASGVYVWVCTATGTPGTWSPVNMP